VDNFAGICDLISLHDIQTCRQQLRTLASCGICNIDDQYFHNFEMDYAKENDRIVRGLEVVRQIAKCGQINVPPVSFHEFEDRLKITKGHAFFRIAGRKGNHLFLSSIELRQSSPTSATDVTVFACHLYVIHNDTTRLLKDANV